MTTDTPTPLPGSGGAPADLAERILQFNALRLPGQMPMMHMGTSYLVNDLWREARRLQSVNADLAAALKAASGYLLNAKIDLETGAPKKTAIRTIEGGLKVVSETLRKAGAAS